MALPSSSRNGARIIWICLHTAEGARRRQDLFAFFDRNQNASSHGGADGTGLDDGWVPDERAAWTLLRGNPRSLNLEMCGFARWTREQWLSTGVVDGVVNPRQMVRNAAEWTRRKCDKHGVPRRKLTPAQVGRGEAGIIDHDDYSDGTGDGDHWDVGENFPWDVFFADMGGTSTEEDDMKLDERAALFGIEGVLAPGGIIRTMLEGLVNALGKTEELLDGKHIGTVVAEQVAKMDAILAGLRLIGDELDDVQAGKVSPEAVREQLVELLKGASVTLPEAA